MSEATPAPASGGDSTVAPEKRIEGPPLLPDGKGLDLKTVRDLIHNYHNQSVPQDDPILVVVTICNAFLGEIEALHQRHEEGLSRLMADKSGAYVADIIKAVDKLSAGLSSASAENLKATTGELEKRLAVFRSSLLWLAAVVSVSALVNVIAFALLAVR